MAVTRGHSKAVRNPSTSRVATPTGPVTTGRPVDNATSTSAVECVMPGETVAVPNGVVVRYPTPTDPITVSIGYLAEDASTKVVTPDTAETK